MLIFFSLFSKPKENSVNFLFHVFQRKHNGLFGTYEKKRNEGRKFKKKKKNLSHYLIWRKTKKIKTKSKFVHRTIFFSFFSHFIFSSFLTLSSIQHK